MLPPRYRAPAALALLLALLAAVWLWPRGEDPAVPGGAMVEVVVPAALSEPALAGKAAFDATCAECHGADAAGVEGLGPPLVHRIYEPSHHGDMAFVLAVTSGVRAHHWSFGDMPAQEGVTGEEIAAIIAYARELQRANGIE